MFNVVVFKGPYVFAELGGVSVFSVAERCGVVSVSCILYIVFEKPPWGKIIKDACMYVSQFLYVRCRFGTRCCLCV